MFTGQPAKTAFGRPMAVSALLHAGLLLLLFGWGGPFGSPLHNAHFVSVSLVTPGASSPASAKPEAAAREVEPPGDETRTPPLGKKQEKVTSAPERSRPEESPAAQAPVLPSEALSPVRLPSGAPVAETIAESASYESPAGPAFVSARHAAHARGRGAEGDASREPGEVMPSAIDSDSAPGDDGRRALIARIQETIEAALVYPPLARKRGLQGTVLAGFRVDGEGRPLDIRVLRSSGHGILDRAVVRTIRRAWPYPPVADVIEVPVRFRLVAGEPPDDRPDR